MPHVFEAFAAILEEGESALTSAGAFLQDHFANVAASQAGGYIEGKDARSSLRSGYGDRDVLCIAEVDVPEPVAGDEEW